MICGSYKLGGKAEVGGSRGEVVILYIYSFAYHWLLWTATTQQVIFLFLNLELEKQLRENSMSYLYMYGEQKKSPNNITRFSARTYWYTDIFKLTDDPEGS